ncbi:aminotransferase class V-fold PLP-dependent enzyme [Streptomyces xantholiticus]|uniref:aminotransferase class V-fold PLP-dependent enzyme n=1 Tax=Streptomyces xantholiticus TaxID=68285 RepID=UPI0016759428|nr:aminotransferase class V-fold PLP-dependent enzyme [Streptomyces xantholiticus]GGW37590.1 aminotransferase class V [Streptomyces xantholiticus]
MYETLDLARARAETPGVNHVVHLNNAGAGLVPLPVLDVMTSYLRLESRVGPYEAAERSEGAVGNAHTALASLLNCSRQEVAILDSATRAWGMAMSSVPLQAGDRVIISAVEYGSNYLSLLHLTERLGVSLEVAPVDGNGLVDVAGLEAMLDERVRLIAMVHVPMHDALVNPVADIGRVSRRHGIPYLVDACQSVGQMPVDVAEIGCDLLVGTGRKFLRGPRGTGFLYVRQELAHKLVPAIVGLDGVEWLSGSYRLAPGARRFETWETNTAARIGLGVAVDYALGWGIERTYARMRRLAAGLRKDLVGMPGVVLHDRGREQCGTIALSFEGRGTFEVRNALKDAGVNTWVCLENAACVDMQQRGLSTLLRVSPHYYNSEQELERFCSVLEDILTGTRRERVLA